MNLQKKSPSRESGSKRHGLAYAASLLSSIGLAIALLAAPAGLSAQAASSALESAVDPAATSDPAADAASEAPTEPPPMSVDGAVGTLTSAVTNLFEAFVRSLPQIGIALVVLIVTGIAASLLQRLFKRLFSRMHLRQSLQDLFGQLIYIAVWFAGLMVACGIVFPSFGIAELVSTAGLLSIAVGFAFQDIFENFFAGILILWRFPFEVDDFIEIESENIMGRVEDIWIRMTLIRLTTGELVTVPNSTVYKSPLRILTNKPLRRITVPCGVAYGEDVGEAREVITKAVKGCESVSDEKDVEIFLTGFGDSSMDFEVTWWTGSKPLDQRRSRDEVIEAVKRALDDADIEIPYPYRVLTFTKNEPLIYDKLAGGGSQSDDPSSSEAN